MIDFEIKRRKIHEEIDDIKESLASGKLETLERVHYLQGKISGLRNAIVICDTPDIPEDRGGQDERSRQGR